MPPRRRTVGFLIDRWEPERGGAERALAALARHLEVAGQRVLCFARRGSPGAPGELRPVHAKGLFRAARERSLAKALVEAAREAQCEVTIGIRHVAELDVFWPHGGAHAQALLARRQSRAGTLDVAPPTLYGRHRVFVELEERLCTGGGARRIVCVSELVRDELARAWPECAPRLAVIENGVDLERFHPRSREEAAVELRERLALDRAAPLIAFSARDPVLKGLPVLGAALSRLQRRWSLVVAGPKHPERWRARLHAAGLPDACVRVLGELDSAELLAASDLLVQPTWRDPFSLTTLEALACGTPVVTTRANGAAHLLDNVSGSVLDDPGDAVALARELERWLERLAHAPPPPDDVRERVRDHGQAPWLARLANVVLDV